MEVGNFSQRIATDITEDEANPRLTLVNSDTTYQPKRISWAGMEAFHHLRLVRHIDRMAAQKRIIDTTDLAQYFVEYFLDQVEIR